MIRVAAAILVAVIGGFAGFEIYRKNRPVVPKMTRPAVESPQDADSLMREAYAETCKSWEENWKKQYPDQGQNLFSDAAGSDFLKANHTVPGFFTQACFDGYVDAQFREKAKTTAKKLKGAEEEILSKLRERYRDEYAGEWEKYLEGIQVKPFGDAKGARDGLQALSGAVSTNPALAKIITEVWSRRVITIDGTPWNVPKRGTEWLKLANDKLTALAKTADDFVKKTAEGQRFRDYVDNKGKVRDRVDLAEAFDTALSEITTIVKAGPERSLLIAVVRRAHEALAQEARDEMNAYWAADARKHFQATLAEKYPFVRTAEAVDATIQDFNDYFKPETGHLAKAAYYLKTLNDIMIDGRPLVKFTPEYEAAAAYALRMRGILYALNKNTVSTRFSVTTTSSQEYGHIMLRVKANETDMKNLIGYRLKDAVWEGGHSVYFKLMAEQRPTKVLYEDKPQTYWGLFRLAESGQIKDKGTGKDYEMSWEYLPGLTITLTLTCDDKDNPFATGFFSKFACPEKVAE